MKALQKILNPPPEVKAPPILKCRLVVQLWGIGNLIQTEPLLRALLGKSTRGVRDILVNPLRSTHLLAPLLPDWNFITRDENIQKVYDEVYLCGPWLTPASFAQVAKRVYTPVWTFNRGWKHSEAKGLLSMARQKISPEDILPVLPPLTALSPWDSGEAPIALSCGWNRLEGDAWQFKDWGEENFVAAINALAKKDIPVLLLGDASDRQVWGTVRSAIRFPELVQDISGSPILEQIDHLSWAAGYLGNDTGWGHLAGAYRLPSAIYTRTDPAKNRTAGEPLWQFTGGVTAADAAGWIARARDPSRKPAGESVKWPGRDEYEDEQKLSRTILGRKRA